MHLTKTARLFPVFATQTEQARFIRNMRLLRDDIIELSSTIGILIALSKRSEDHELSAALNRNPVFWDAILNSLHTSSFVVIGRVHDTTRTAYLPSITKFAGKTKSLSIIAGHFDGLLKVRADLIATVIRLRQRVFAHSSFHRPENISFGFKSLTWNQFEAYWRDLARITELLEQNIFGHEYGPKCNPDQLDEDITRANQAFDALCDWRGS